MPLVKRPHLNSELFTQRSPEILLFSFILLSFWKRFRVTYFFPRVQELPRMNPAVPFQLQLPSLLSAPRQHSELQPSARGRDSSMNSWWLLFFSQPLSSQGIAPVSPALVCHRCFLVLKKNHSISGHTGWLDTTNPSHSQNEITAETWWPKQHSSANSWHWIQLSPQGAMRVYEPNPSPYQKVIAFSHVQGVLIFTWDKTKYKYAVPVLIQPVGLLKEADTEDN